MEPGSSDQSTRDPHTSQQQMPAAVEAVIQFGYPQDLVWSTYQRLTTQSSSHEAPRSGSDQAAASVRRANAVSAPALLSAVQNVMESISELVPSVSTSNGSDSSVPALPATGTGVVSSASDTTTSAAATISTEASTISASASSADNARSSPTSTVSSSVTPNASVPVEEAAQRKVLLERLRVLRAENRRLKNRQTCQKCHSKPVALTFLPCGHFLYCEECGTQFDNCPVCKKTILADVKTFL